MTFTPALKCAAAKLVVTRHRVPLVRFVAWMFVLLGCVFSLVWSASLAFIIVRLLEFA